MGLYANRVLPRLVDVACGTKASGRLREQVCAALTGEVVEIGFGSGHNVPHYPVAVARVTAVEPADLAWRLAAQRVEAARCPVERSGLDGQDLPFADDSFDSALSTWTLCTIPDAVAALAELRRVLRPGGSLHFLEHGLAPDANVQAWQRRLEPLQKRVAGGCHLTREVEPMLVAAGFTLTALETFYEPGAPKVLAADSLGVAVVP